MSYNEKNRIYKDLRKETKNNIVFSKSVKLNKKEINEISDDNEKSFNNKSIKIFNYNIQNKQLIDNNEYTLEKQKNENEKEKIKTLNQIRKESKNEINCNNNNLKKDNENQILNNNSLNTTTNRKQKKYIIPQNFQMNYNNL